jgi:hypothetical protein
MTWRITAERTTDRMTSTSVRYKKALCLSASLKLISTPLPGFLMGGFGSSQKISFDFFLQTGRLLSRQDLLLSMTFDPLKQ